MDKAKFGWDYSNQKIKILHKKRIKIFWIIFFFCHCHKRNKKTRENNASPRLNQNNRIVWQPGLKQSSISHSP